jgi:hypothetical protein
MSVLQYPQELQPGQTDYILFTNHEYKTNKKVAGQQSAGGSGPSQGASIILYMPTTTPAVTQNNDWGAKTFDGPLGEVVRDLASSAASGLNKADFSSFEAGMASGKAAAKTFVDDFKAKFKDGTYAGAAKQFGTNLVAGAAGMTPNQLTALQRGEIYNPNVELLYTGPKLRGFNFNFTFVPKSAAEAQQINQIIMEFKKWSAPLNLQNGMFKVPNVWQVQYMSNGKPNKNMNQFKRAACMSVAVQNNQGMNMHMSFNDGMPIVTTMALSFMEVDVITRNDHESSTSSVGY